MPVVQSYYSAQRAKTPSVLASYWKSFLAERGGMNRKILEQHFAQMDPTLRAKEAEALRNSIAELMEERSKILRGGIKGRADIMTNVAAGIYSVEAAKVQAGGRVAAARTELEGTLIEVEEAERERQREATTLSDGQIGQLLGASGDVKAGVGEVDAYRGRLAKAMEEASGTAQSRDYLALEFHRRAVEQGHSKAADFIAEIYFPGSGYSEADVLDAYENRYGRATASSRDARRDRAMSHGAGGAADPLQVLRDVSTAIDPTAPPFAGRPGEGGAEGAGGAQPGAGGQPDLFGFGAMRQDEQRATSTIDRQIAGLQAQLDALQADRTAPDRFGPFTQNYLLQPMFTKKHRSQNIADVAAQAPRQMVVEAGEALEGNRGPLGRTSYRGAREDLAADGWQPREDKHWKDSDRTGMALYDWVAAKLRHAEAAPDEVTRTEILNEIRDLERRLPAYARDESATPFWSALAEPETSSRDLLILADAIADEDDVHIAEMVGDQVSHLLKAETPTEQVAASRALGVWLSHLPPSLTGVWSGVGDTLESDIKARDGRQLIVDLHKIRAEAYKVAGGYSRPAGDRAAADAQYQAGVEAGVDEVLPEYQQHGAGDPSVARRRDLSGSERPTVSPPPADMPGGQWAVSRPDGRTSYHVDRTAAMNAASGWLRMNQFAVDHPDGRTTYHTAGAGAGGAAAHRNLEREPDVPLLRHTPEGQITDTPMLSPPPPEAAPEVLPEITFEDSAGSVSDLAALEADLAATIAAAEEGDAAARARLPELAGAVRAARDSAAARSPEDEAIDTFF